MMRSHSVAAHIGQRPKIRRSNAAEQKPAVQKRTVKPPVTNFSLTHNINSLTDRHGLTNHNGFVNTNSSVYIGNGLG